MDITEYKNRARKTVTLPSGLELTIRKLSVADIYGIQPTGIGKSDEIDASMKMICACVVSPFRIVQKNESECGDMELPVEYIDNKDYEFLIQEITEFSGLSEKKSDPNEAADASCTR